MSFISMDRKIDGKERKLYWLYYINMVIINVESIKFLESCTQCYLTNSPPINYRKKTKLEKCVGLIIAVVY